MKRSWRLLIAWVMELGLRTAPAIAALALTLLAARWLLRDFADGIDRRSAARRGKTNEAFS